MHFSALYTFGLLASIVSAVPGGNNGYKRDEDAASYDPKAVGDVFKKLAAGHGDEVPEDFFSLGPVTGTIIWGLGPTVPPGSQTIVIGHPTPTDEFHIGTPSTTFIIGG
ncbi:hypothetical protein FQN50_003138 [Emmonsiellopsis sp. PD_5]|nr:hypothetical protein FQN50_003138 [Emmonsiellopsis sp. PD_5]